RPLRMGGERRGRPRDRVRPHRYGEGRRARAAGAAARGGLDDRAGRGILRRLWNALRSRSLRRGARDPVPGGDGSRADLAGGRPLEGGPLMSAVLIVDDSLTVRMDLAQAF